MRGADLPVNSGQIRRISKIIITPGTCFAVIRRLKWAADEMKAAHEPYYIMIFACL